MKQEPPMRNRAKSTEPKQGGAIATVGQLWLQMVAGIARSKQARLEWVHQVGLAALSEVFEYDAEQLDGQTPPRPWSKSGLDYWAVSNLASGELEDFVRRARGG
jgi:hypothetical protein